MAQATKRKRTYSNSRSRTKKDWKTKQLFKINFSIISAFLATVIAFLFLHESPKPTHAQHSDFNNTRLSQETPNTTSDAFGMVLNKKGEANCAANYPFGMPYIPNSQAKSILICHDFYALQYSPTTRTPLWVAHTLQRENILSKNKVGREDNFREDPQLLEAARKYAVSGSDYRGSGYDRGHLAPSADFTWNKRAMDESFYMTNMAPQLGEHNSGVWNSLEDGVRKLMSKYQTLYVVTGVLFGKNPQTISSGVMIPDAFYKVVVSAQTGDAVAFLIPQDKHLVKGKAPRIFAMTIRNLEKQTGINFHSRLANQSADFVENNTNLLNMRTFEQGKKSNR